MSIHGFALFSLVYLLATATQGPGIGAILARVIARGTAGMGFFIAGFVALLPTVIDLTRLSLTAFLEIAVTMCVILTAVLSSYAVAARRARKLFRSQSAIRWLNRGTGTVVAGAAIAVATR
ncbi:MAG TPA: hypothetical protein VN676_03765 [Steroidobacteraceae bacterium]|nr:hypothetical protein [Steroidobacteraceae bacterium]